MSTFTRTVTLNDKGINEVAHVLSLLDSLEKMLGDNHDYYGHTAREQLLYLEYLYRQIIMANPLNHEPALDNDNKTLNIKDAH